MYLVGIAIAFYLTRVPEGWIGQGRLTSLGIVIRSSTRLSTPALSYYGAAIVFLKARDEMGARPRMGENRRN